MDLTDDQPAVKAKLDRCVKCGMCLPECPTYRLTGDENESPRGRLALIEGLVDKRLKADSSVHRHLDTCLACRRCESVCPSGVEYGHLIEYARTQLSPRTHIRWLSLLQQPALMRGAGQIAHKVPQQLSKPFRRLHRLHLLGGSMLHTSAPPISGVYPTGRQSAKGRVGLFLGCATAAEQGGALKAAVEVLNRGGFDVEIPANQGCCGALAQHAGDTAAAKRQSNVLRQQFTNGLDAVISIASGCGVHINSYESPLAVPHRDICEFLITENGLTTSDFKPLGRTVLSHVPCTMNNVYRGSSWPSALLSLIPELTITPLGEAGQCCGSAGDYMLRHPETAEALRRPLLDQIQAEPQAYVTTTNIGCAMHIAAGLLEHGERREVLHPVELLARQLISNTN